MQEYMLKIVPGTEQALNKSVIIIICGWTF